MDPSKYSPISFLNMGGKVLEELLINRIYHHVYRYNLLTPNFTAMTTAHGTKIIPTSLQDYTVRGMPLR